MAKRIKVWFIYQGKKADPIMKGLARKFLKTEARKWAVFHESGYNEDSADGTIYSRVTKDARACDAAVAIVTLDDRDAWVAGNLWFEIGLWLAQKPERDLVLCVDRKIDKRKLKGPISDLVGKVAKPFSGVGELWTIVHEHIMNVHKRYRTPLAAPPGADRPPELKVRDTFAPPDTRWESDASYYCPNPEKTEAFVCPYRKASLGFSAELLRMGRVNRERSFIASDLIEIGTLADQVCRTHGRMGKGTDFRDLARQGLLDALFARIEEFFSQVNDLLARGKNAYRGDRHDPHERLAEFIEDRLDVAERVLTAMQHRDLVRSSMVMRGNAEDFVVWAEKLCDNCKASGYYQYGEGGGSANEVARVMKSWADYCHAAGLTLELLGRSTFKSCRRVLTKHLRKATGPEHLANTLEAVVRELPHNRHRPKRRCFRIWPSTDPVNQ